MLKIHEIEEAIAELEGAKNHTPAMCAQLASFYTIRDHMRGQSTESYASQPIESIAAYSSAPAPVAAAPVMTVQASANVYGDSDFLQAIKGQDLSVVWPVLDELMGNLHVVNPRVYESVMAKLRK